MKPSKDSLRLVFWETTIGCNLKCVHCRAAAELGRSPEELTTQQSFDLVDQIADFADPILVLSGGEPLYLDDVFDISDHASSKGLCASLLSRDSLAGEGGREEDHASDRRDGGCDEGVSGGFRRVLRVLQRRGGSLRLLPRGSRRHAKDNTG